MDKNDLLNTVKAAIEKHGFAHIDAEHFASVVFPMHPLNRQTAGRIVTTGELAAELNEFCVAHDLQWEPVSGNAIRFTAAINGQPAAEQQPAKTA